MALYCNIYINIFLHVDYYNNMHDYEFKKLF